MFDYTALGTLRVLVTEGSFEKAAWRLNVTPSAVSQRIKLLEERAGQALIVRGKPCIPTEAGLELCQHIQQVQILEADLGERWHNLFVDATGSTKLSLSVAMNSDSLATWMMPAAGKFFSKTGKMLKFVTDDQDHTAARLLSGEVVAAVTTSKTPVAGCIVKKLGSLQYVAAASPRYILRHFSNGLTEEAIHRAHGIVFDERDTLLDQWMQKAVGHAVRISSHKIPSPQGIVDASLQGMGWSVHVETLISKHINDGRLEVMRPDCRLSIPLYWQVRDVSSEILGELTRIVRSVAKKTVK